MHKNTTFEDVDERSRWLIRQKAEQLVGHYGFTESDVEDIEQDLVIHLMLRLRSYNPSRGARATFVQSVVENKIRSIRKEDRQSGSYDHRLVGKSLDEPVAADDDTSLVFGDTLSSDSTGPRNNRGHLSESEQSDLRIDIGRALSEMTPELRELCARLTESNVADIARETGIPRHRLQWMRTRVRQIFLKFRLDEYL